MYLMYSCAVQVDQQELRDAGYSPATVTDLERWRLNVAARDPRFARTQHTAAAVSAITFIMEHEPNPGEFSVTSSTVKEALDIV
jgi:hypothetical protein